MSVLEEKDRLGQKLRDLEKAREDQWAAQQDRELLEKMRLKAQAPRPRRTCPCCGQVLENVTRGVLPIALCAEHGAWIEREALELLVAEGHGSK